MKLSIFVLNINGLADRENRMPKILKILLDKKPDIIALQEVQTKENQIDQNMLYMINGELNYKYHGYSNCFNYANDYGKGILINPTTKKPDNIEEGLALISNIPFTFSTIQLPIVHGLDRWPRIAMICNFDTFTLSNIHLSSKGTISSYLQREHVPKTDIIVGDFNMKPQEINLIKGNYSSSYDYKQYISYVSEGNTFDYLLLKGSEFSSLETFDNLSDHSGIYAEIEI